MTEISRTVGADKGAVPARERAAAVWSAALSRCFSLGGVAFVAWGADVRRRRVRSPR